MVPLPLEEERIFVLIEFIGGHQRGGLSRRQGDCQAVRRLPPDAYLGPPVPPRHREKHGNTAYCAMVLEEHGVPVSVRRVEDAALGYTLVTVPQVVVHNDLSLISAKKIGGTVTPLDPAAVAGGWPLDEEDGIHTGEVIGGGPFHVDAVTF